MQERRQIKRIGSSLFIKFASNLSNGVESEGFTRDVSLSGARMLSLKKTKVK